MKEVDRVIELRDVSKSWDGRTVLSGVNLDVDRGDFIAVTGPNGGGKTTLLRIILKLLPPSTGSVTYLRHGVPVKDLSVGYLPQKNMIDSRFPITVAEVVGSGLIGEKLPKPVRAERVEETLALIGLESHRDQSIGALSGGQLQRALLGRAIISRPGLLVLDEPLSYLDKKFEHRIYDLVRHLAASTTIILVSHEMTEISGMATRHLIVNHTITECRSAHHCVHYDCDDC